MVEATSPDHFRKKTFLGIPTKILFRIQKKRALIIGCNEYANLRELTGKPYGNLEETMEDIKVVRQGLRRFKFLKKNIVTLINPDAAEVKREIMGAYR